VLPDGSLVIAARGTDNQLWVNRRVPGKGWQGWLPGGGLLSARPDVTSDGAGNVVIAARGADGRTWLTSIAADGEWGSWTGLGGGILEGAGPGVAASAAGVVDVVVLGTDGAPWRRTGKPTSKGTDWTPWVRLSGAAKGDVGLSGSSAGPVLAVRGPDDRAYVQRLSPSGESGWTALGGALSSAPTVAAATGTDRADVVVYGTDGRLYRSSGTGPSWSGWTELR
jgi:hypothetical protein